MIIYKKPLPDIEEAKHAIERMYTSCRECDFYNMYTPQMVTTNEFYQIRDIEPYITSGAKVLTVCGPGEQPLFLKSYGAGDIVTFDISYHSYLLTSLKIAALQSFDDTQDFRKFIDILYYKPSELLTNPFMYNVVEKLNKVEKDYLSKAMYNQMHIFWSAQSCFFYTMPQNYYDNVRNLVKKPFPFIWTDITELGDKLKIPGKNSDKSGEYETFDIIYYSNILEFMQPYNIRQVLENTINFMKPDCKLFLTIRNIPDSIELITYAVNNVYDSSEWDTELLSEKQGFRQFVIQRAR